MISSTRTGIFNFEKNTHLITLERRRRTALLNMFSKPATSLTDRSFSLTDSPSTSLNADSSSSLADDFNTASVEDLSSCIEHCSVIYNKGTLDERIDSFYYDSRFGNRIDSNVLHNYYKNNKDLPSIKVFPVKEVKEILRVDNVFYISLVNENSITTCTEVKFYTSDKSFICRTHDPSVIIKAICSNAEALEYLQDQQHPMFDAGYSACYSIRPKSNFYSQNAGGPLPQTPYNPEHFTSNATSNGYAVHWDDEKQADGDDGIPSLIPVRRTPRPIRPAEYAANQDKKVSIVYEDDFDVNANNTSNLDDIIYMNRPMRVQEPESDSEDSDDRSNADSTRSGYIGNGSDDEYRVDSPTIDDEDKKTPDEDALDILSQMNPGYYLPPSTTSLDAIRNNSAKLEAYLTGNSPNRPDIHSSSYEEYMKKNAEQHAAHTQQASLIYANATERQIRDALLDRNNALSDRNNAPTALSFSHIQGALASKDASVGAGATSVNASNTNVDALAAYRKYLYDAARSRMLNGCFPTFQIPQVPITIPNDIPKLPKRDDNVNDEDLQILSVHNNNVEIYREIGLVSTAVAEPVNSTTVAEPVNSTTVAESMNTVADNAPITTNSTADTSTDVTIIVTDSATTVTDSATNCIT